MATESLSLLEFLRELLANGPLRDYFTDHPQAALREYGLDDLSPDDVHDALVLVEDNQTADFSRSYDTGYNSVHLSSPPAVVHSDGDEHQAAVSYLNSYLTDNHVEDRDTTVDDSINQQIDTGGGDFDQDIDIDQVTASGDGAVAAGGDIDGSTITTGRDNQVGDGDVRGDGDVVGDGNQAGTGDGDTTSFGAGDATSTTVDVDVDVGAVGAFASGGDAALDRSDHSLDHVGDSYTDESADHSFDDFSDNHVEHSGNADVDASTHDSGNESDHTDIDGSFDDDSDHSVDG